MNNMPPISVFILDFIGCVLLGIGTMEKFAGIDLVPDAYRIPNFENFILMAGILCFIPATVWLIKRISSKQ
ncbi:MAG: DUF1418 family protein [Porticoccaceae bacterium]